MTPLEELAANQIFSALRPDGIAALRSVHKKAMPQCYHLAIPLIIQLYGMGMTAQDSPQRILDEVWELANKDNPTKVNDETPTTIPVT